MTEAGLPPVAEPELAAGCAAGAAGVETRHKPGRRKPFAPDASTVWRLVVTPAATAGLVQFIESRNLHLFPMPTDGDEDLPSYGIGIGPKLVDLTKGEVVMSQEHGRGPLRSYKVVWTNGVTETVAAHQVLMPQDDTLTEFPVAMEQRGLVQFHGEVDGEWRLLLAIRPEEISMIRDTTAEGLA